MSNRGPFRPRGRPARDAHPPATWALVRLRGPRNRRRARALLTFAAAVALVCECAGVAAAQASDEPQLQAAFVSKFPEFVEWPAAAWDGRPTLVLCVARHSPLAPHLRALTIGASLRGRPYEVRELDASSALPPCHVLVVKGDDRALLAKARGLPILTVSDDPSFLDRGGIIQLSTIDRRIRFEIGLASAQRVDLRLSSQLLGLAMHVRGGRS